MLTNVWLVAIGDGIKWKHRGPALEAELLSYSPDILFLQEIDQARFKDFWKPLCFKLGLDSYFSTYPGKQHGLVIAFNKSMFVLKEKKEIWYDSLHLDGFQMRPATKNTGIIAALEVKTPDEPVNYSTDSQATDLEKTKTDETLRQELLNVASEGMIIATTHSYWHPFGSFERAIQCGQLLQESFAFSQAQGNSQYKHWPIILAGDFNSTPDDLPYQFLIKQPRSVNDLNKKAIDIAAKSLAYLYGKTQFVKTVQPPKQEGEEEEPFPIPMKKEDIVLSENEDGLVTEISSDYVNLCLEAVLSLYSLDGRSSSNLSSANLNNKPIDRTVQSIYGSYYKEVDIDNAKKYLPEFGEPEFSNWAHAWRGLLDYIFIVQETDQAIDDKRKVIVKELLKLPKGSEMGKEPSGQPRIGQYPSDHLCLMATIEI